MHEFLSICNNFGRSHSITKGRVLVSKVASSSLQACHLEMTLSFKKEIPEKQPPKQQRRLSVWLLRLHYALKAKNFTLLVFEISFVAVSTHTRMRAHAHTYTHARTRTPTRTYVHVHTHPTAAASVFLEKIPLA